MKEEIKKTRKTTGNPRFRKVFAYLSENVGGVTAAMRRAGYSQTYIDSGHFMKTKTYIETLNAIGLTDDMIGKSVEKLATASRHEQRTFPAKATSIGKGKKARWIYKQIPDEDIRKIIESIPDSKLLYISNQGREKIAYYIVPDLQARKGGLEMIHKSKSLFAPERFEDVTPPSSEEDVAAVDAVLGRNKK